MGGSIRPPAVRPPTELSFAEKKTSAIEPRDEREPMLYPIIRSWATACFFGPACDLSEHFSPQVLGLNGIDFKWFLW